MFHHAAIALVGGIALLGCNSVYEEFPVDQVCRDVGYAISARTFECAADTKLAEERYDRFISQYRCLISEVERTPIDVYYHCAAQITAVGCEQVDRYGDDLLPYLQLSPTCRQFLAGPGLEGSAGAGGDGGSGGEAGAAGGPMP